MRFIKSNDFNSSTYVCSILKLTCWVTLMFVFLNKSASYIVKAAFGKQLEAFKVCRL